MNRLNMNKMRYLVVPDAKMLFLRHLMSDSVFVAMARIIALKSDGLIAYFNKYKNFIKNKEIIKNDTRIYGFNINTNFNCWYDIY